MCIHAFDISNAQQDVNCKLIRFELFRAVPEVVLDSFWRAAIFSWKRYPNGPLKLAVNGLFLLLHHNRFC